GKGYGPADGFEQRLGLHRRLRVQPNRSWAELCQIEINLFDLDALLASGLSRLGRHQRLQVRPRYTGRHSTVGRSGQDHYRPAAAIAIIIEPHVGGREVEMDVRALDNHGMGQHFQRLKGRPRLDLTDAGRILKLSADGY